MPYSLLTFFGWFVVSSYSGVQSKREFEARQDQYIVEIQKYMTDKKIQMNDIVNFQAYIIILIFVS